MSNKSTRPYTTARPARFDVKPLVAGLALALGALPASTVVADDALAATTAYQHALQQRQAKQAGLQSASRPTPPVVRGGTVREVTSCADDGSEGTLRSVLLIAEEDDTVDMSALTCSTITLDPALGSLDMGVFGDNQLYRINLVGPGRDELTIDGAGATNLIEHIAFSGSQAFLSISDLSLANGTYAGGLAACINASGSLTLTRVDISGCQTTGGGPQFAAAVIASTLAMTDSTVTGSTGTTAGPGDTRVVLGAVYADTAELVNSTISGNTITSESGGNGTNYFTAGGGLYVRGDASITQSTISGNTATTTGTGLDAIGGGVFATGDLIIENSTIDGNVVDGDGGGVFKARFSNYGDPGTFMTIANSTISGNSAARGGGISSARPSTIANSTIAFNDAQNGAGGMIFQPVGADNLQFDFQSTILASNTVGETATLPTDLGSTGNLIVAGASNVIGDAGAFALPPDTLADDPLLVALADNGGPTRTHALEEDSPAIDAGNNAGAFEFDQRGEGFPRVVGAAADIGAFESEGGVIDDTIFRNGFELEQSVTYLLDDGDGETNQGPPSSFDPDMLWGNYFLTEAGGETITEISVAFGPTGNAVATGPVTFWLLDDPDMDMDPRNATSLVSVQGTPDVFNDNFFTVQIPPTQVSGAFFIGASARLLGGVDRPARVDTNAPGDQSWFFYAPEIADVIDDLASAPFGSRMDDTEFVVFPGAFMIRGTGGPGN
jgi:hypothetical protein